jgi:hypothetical protein
MVWSAPTIAAAATIGSILVRPRQRPSDDLDEQIAEAARPNWRPDRQENDGQRGLEVARTPSAHRSPGW